MTNNNCFLCGEYGGSQIAHDESETHRQNYFKHLKEENKNRKCLKVEEQINIDLQLEKILNYYESNMILECGNQYSEIECKFEGTKEEVIGHEKTCIKFKREIVIETPKNDKKTYSSETATCERCGKVYLHTTKLLPKYGLARHQKNCKGNLPYKQRVKDFMITASDEQLKKLYDFMKTI